MQFLILLLSCKHFIEVKHGPTVRCPLTEAFPEGRARFSEYDVSGNCLLTQQVTLRKGEVTLPVIQLVGEGSLSFPGSPPLGVAWSNFYCERVEAPPAREVCGRVAGNFGGKISVRVRDGERVAVNTTERSGDFCVRADGEHLDVVASRFDGHLMVEVHGRWTPAAGAEFAVHLPSKRQGGVGVLVESLSDERYRVIRAIDGMPAAAAGITAGTEILVADPKTGDIGTPITVRVVSGDSTREVELSRELFVDDPAREAVALPGNVTMLTRGEGIVL